MKKGTASKEASLVCKGLVTILGDFAARVCRRVLSRAVKRLKATGTSAGQSSDFTVAPPSTGLVSGLPGGRVGRRNHKGRLRAPTGPFVSKQVQRRRSRDFRRYRLKGPPGRAIVLAF